MCIYKCVSNRRLLLYCVSYDSEIYILLRRGKKILMEKVIEQREFDDPKYNELLMSYSAKGINTTTMTECIFNLLDLLYHMWDSTSSAIFNLKLIIGFVSKYTANQLEIAPTESRVREGSNVKCVLTDLLHLYTQKGPLSLVCSKENLRKFINEHQHFKDTIERVAISPETYSDWLRDYKEYLKNNKEAKRACIAAANAVAAVAVAGDKKEEEEEEEDIGGTIGTEEEENGSGGGGGLDSLFDSSTAMRGESSMFQQYITKLENGRLFSLKTSGEETGKELVRLYVYDVKDIAKIEKRHWWRYAKLRTQFFSPLTTSRGNRKRSLLRQLLDETADELKKQPGAIMETSKIDYFGYNNN